MRQIIIKLLLFFILLLPASCEILFSQSIELSQDLVLKQITHNTFLVSHSFPWQANSLVAQVSDSDFILVDTPWTDEATKQLVDWIKTRSENTRIIAINTHFHRDNLGGNSFLRSQNIPIYGTNLTDQLLHNKKQELKKRTLKYLQQPKYKRFYGTYKKQKLQPPTVTFDINIGPTFEFDKEFVEIYYSGPAHAEDNIVVYFRNRKLLFGGCMIKSMNRRTIGKNSDAKYKKWPESLMNVLKKFNDAEIVVPGHGPIGDIKLIHHTLNLLRKND